MKMTKSRKDYKCHNCKAAISKGDLYRKKTLTIGNPGKWSTESPKPGHVVYVQHGISIGVQICEACV